MGSIELRPDGSTSHTGVGWSADAQTLKLCGGGDCLTCVDLDPPPPPPSSDGNEMKCTGSPDSCSSNSPGSCSDIRGCRMVSRVKYNGTYDNYCDGTPDDCEDISSEEACYRQGCDWR